MKERGVVCFECGTWYLEPYRLAGRRCGDLSQGQQEVQGCPGICQRYTQHEVEIWKAGIRRARNRTLTPYDGDVRAGRN